MYSVSFQKIILQCYLFYDFPIVEGGLTWNFNYYKSASSLYFCLSSMSRVVTASKFCLLNVHQSLFDQVWLIMDSEMRWNIGSSYIFPWIQSVAGIFLNSKWFHWCPEWPSKRGLTQQSTESDDHDSQWNDHKAMNRIHHELWSKEPNIFTLLKHFIPKLSQRDKCHQRSRQIFTEDHSKKCSGLNQML